MVYSLRRLRDDVVERRNPAAGLVVAGETIAAACCIGGSNIGNGPGPEAVVFCPVLSSGTLLLFWLILDRVASVNDTVTIERDRQAGLRLGAYLVATGAILGASVTGDWVSVEATTSDFLPTSGRWQFSKTFDGRIVEIDGAGRVA